MQVKHLSLRTFHHQLKTAWSMCSKYYQPGRISLAVFGTKPFNISIFFFFIETN